MTLRPAGSGPSQDQRVMMRAEVEGTHRGQSVGRKHSGRFRRGETVVNGRSLGRGSFLPVDVDEEASRPEDSNRFVDRPRGNAVQNIGEQRHIRDGVVERDVGGGGEQRLDIGDLHRFRPLPDKCYKLVGDIDRKDAPARADPLCGRERVEPGPRADVHDDLTHPETHAAPEFDRVLRHATLGRVEYGDRVLARPDRFVHAPVVAAVLGGLAPGRGPGHGPLDPSATSGRRGRSS